MEKKILIQLDTGFWVFCIILLLFGSVMFSQKIGSVVNKAFEGVKNNGKR